MSLDNVDSGFNSTVEFRSSSIPYWDSSLAPIYVVGCKRIDFPRVTNFITITNNEANGTYLRIAFTRYDVLTSGNYFKLNGGQTVKFALKCTSIFLAGDVTDTNYTLCAGLTNIDAIQMPALQNSSLDPTFFTPNSLSPALWLRADLGVTQVTGSISRWVDQSPNGIIFTQATGSNQPTLVADINGLSSIAFNGTSTSLIKATGSFTPNVGPHATYIVFKPYTTAGGGRTVYDQRGTGGFNVWAPDVGTQVNFNVVAGTSKQLGVAAINVPALFGENCPSAAANATTLRLYNSKLTTNISFGTTSALTTIGSKIGGTEYYSGSIAEIFVTSRAITTVEETALLGYFNARYMQSWV